MYVYIHICIYNIELLIELAIDLPIGLPIGLIYCPLTYCGQRVCASEKVEASGLVLPRK